jgi:hypothetical protein
VRVLATGLAERGQQIRLAALPQPHNLTQRAVRPEICRNDLILDLLGSLDHGTVEQQAHQTRSVRSR